MNIADKGYLPRTDGIGKITTFRRICLFFIGLLMVTCYTIRGQEADADTIKYVLSYVRDVLQADQHLIHGTRYYDLYPNAPGHPFIEPDEFMTGSIIINKREYAPVLLKYDICDQRVLLRYPLNIGGYTDIVLIDEPIGGFAIGNMVFRIYPLPKKGARYCQEIGKDSLKCLYFWHKELVPLNNSLESYNQYTNQARNSYLFMNGQVLEFRWKKSFLKCFPVTMQPSIRKYMKEKRISLRQATDADMKNLILFCGILTEENHMEMQDRP